MLTFMWRVNLAEIKREQMKLLKIWNKFAASWKQISCNFLANDIADETKTVQVQTQSQRHLQN